MSVAVVNDIKQYISLAQKLQEEANKYQIFHVFEDGGYKEFIMLKMFELNHIEGKHGDDGEDGKGRRMELKTVNLISTKGEMRRNLGVTTCHHLNYDIIKRYRNVSSWLVGIFHINEPARIYEIETEKLEPYFQKWEKQLDEKRGKGERKPHLNNPKIGVRHIIEHGTVVYENCDFDTYFETKSKGKEKMDKDYVISLLEQKGYRQKNILEEHLIPMWNGEKKVVVVLVTEDLTKENMFYLLNEVKKETNEFYILAESEKVLYLKAKREFLMWINEKIGGINKAQGKIKANFSTIEKIASSKQIWEHLIF